MSLKFTIAECPLFGKNGTTLVTPDGRIWKYKSAFYVCQECEKTNVKVTATIKQPYYIIRGQHICNDKNYAEIIKNFSGEEATVITAEQERSTIPPRTLLYNIRLRSRTRSNTNNLTNSNSSENIPQNSLPSTSTSTFTSSPKQSLNVSSKKISKKKKNQRPVARKTITNRTSQTKKFQSDSVPAPTTASEYTVSVNLNNSIYDTLNQYPSTATQALKTKSSSKFIRNEFATNLTASLGTESFSRSQTSRQQQRLPAKSLPQKSDSTTSTFSRASTTTSNNTNNTDNIDQKFTPPEEDEDSIIFIEPEIQIIEECINNARRNMPITFSSPIIQQFNKRNLHNFEIHDRPQTSVNQVPQISSTPK
uniref:Uncharacterized protein n=1 Tax=Panagrolaimus superbus TaxID=310955 RepID=A0A914Y7K4_9BILA